jgi:hypothetical protein
MKAAGYQENNPQIQLTGVFLNLQTANLVKVCKKRSG